MPRPPKGDERLSGSDKAESRSSDDGLPDGFFFDANFDSLPSCRPSSLLRGSALSLPLNLSSPLGGRGTLPHSTHYQ